MKAKEIEQKIKEGVHREEAIQQAIRQMGDPILLGKQLHKVHKPKMEWGLIGIYNH
ncbi:permease prefix domain 1-containing protein [Aneurinibacillus aneurinilyticus]|uniref:permease prefix domain 1-containing protein n=1 Tax=Aneurinibacillus aneurinilyticus TaxID=1391 RepID=UPI00399CB56E